MRRFFQLLILCGTLGALMAASPIPPQTPILSPGIPTVPPPSSTPRPTSASAAATGANTNKPALPPSNPTTWMGNDSGSTNLSRPMYGDLANYVPDDKYKLRPLDRLSFVILEDRDPSRSMQLNENGELEVPYVGRIKAEGKTCKQFADEIKGLLEKAYYYKATVIVAVDSANRVLGRVYVLGQVRGAGPVEIYINENLTVAKAILRAGGFNDFANKKKVRVIRNGKTEGEAKPSFEINVAEILEDGKAEKDLPVEPEDFIIVPSRLLNW